MAKGEFIDTEGNRQAGAAMKRLRERFGSRRRNRTLPMPQRDFGKLLGDELGTTPSQAMVSKWEGAESTVPAAALIAAARILERRLGREPTMEELGLKRSWLGAVA